MTKARQKNKTRLRGAEAAARAQLGRERVRGRALAPGAREHVRARAHDGAQLRGLEPAPEHGAQLGLLLRRITEKQFG